MGTIESSRDIILFHERLLQDELNEVRNSRLQFFEQWTWKGISQRDRQLHSQDGSKLVGNEISAIVMDPRLKGCCRLLSHMFSANTSSGVCSWGLPCMTHVRFHLQVWLHSNFRRLISHQRQLLCWSVRFFSFRFIWIKDSTTTNFFVRHLANSSCRSWE